jgi:hypothetical protein
MAGAPSQLELFDYKPDLMKLDGKDCPASFLEGKKFAFIRGVPQMMGPQAQFQQVGQSGAGFGQNASFTISGRRYFVYQGHVHRPV